MACLAVNFHSEALRKACSTHVLLHGLSDDHTIWMRRTSIERYVQDLPLIVVVPDGGRSFFWDAVAGPACETHLIRDVDFHRRALGI